MYDYQEQRPEVLIPQGQKMLLQIWNNIVNHANDTFTMREVTQRITGDSWTMLACLDYLVELNFIRETKNPTGMGQHRTFFKIT